MAGAVADMGVLQVLIHHTSPESRNRRGCWVLFVDGTEAGGCTEAHLASYFISQAWFSPSVKWASSSQADGTIAKDQEKEWPVLTFSNMEVGCS